MHLTRPISIAHLLLAFITATSIADEAVDFVRDVRPLFEKHCYSCHAEEKQKSGLRLDIKSEAFKGGELYGPSVVAGDGDSSPLIQFIRDEDADLQMPPEGERLSAAEIATLVRWVEQGAVWPDGVDRAKLVDKTDHWSFKPVLAPQVPATRLPDWSRTPIDEFILARLESAGLRPSPETDRASWLRRVTFDLTGLPPTPEEVAAFVANERPAAYAQVVNDLLASPRYGERWAQHWLDVVRYADTHGFEVNTERPNAWPYRDYVIEAFNNDKPYDRFVREQIVGDALGEDAATGFLVTASVLLPGQIGKDAPSMRLARQDSLDEIVVNISQTFLGLSVGCARCHDHKFDPISQHDYYALQACVAGVEYEERELRTPEAEELRAEAARLKDELVNIERQLAGLVPLANSGVQRVPVNARLNIDRFEPVKAKRLRFTIAATNRLEPAWTNWRCSTPPAPTLRSPRPARRSGRRAIPWWPTATSCAMSTTANTETRAVGCRTNPAAAGSNWNLPSRATSSASPGDATARPSTPIDWRPTIASKWPTNRASGNWWPTRPTGNLIGATESAEPELFATSGLSDADARATAKLLERRKSLIEKLSRPAFSRSRLSASFARPTIYTCSCAAIPSNPPTASFPPCSRCSAPAR